MQSRTLAWIFLLALLPTLALAVTLQELTTTADALLDDLEDLETAVDACPDGSCGNAQQLVDDFDTLETDRSDLHDDRDTLDPCTTCGSVDQTIESIDDLADTLGVALGGWDVETLPQETCHAMP